MKSLVLIALVIFTITACQKADLPLLSEIEGKYRSENLYYHNTGAVDQVIWEMEINSNGRVKLHTPGSTGSSNRKITGISKSSSLIYPGYIDYVIEIGKKKHFIAKFGDTLILESIKDIEVFSTQGFTSNYYGLRYD